MQYILVVTATVLLALDFSLTKKYQLSEGTSISAGLRFNALSGLFTAVIFLTLSGFRITLSAPSLILAFCTSLCGMAYNIIGFRILKAGGLAVYSLFLMLGGMLLPYAFGVLFLEEPLPPFRIAGVLLIAIAVVFSAKTKHRFGRSVYLGCFAVFFLNGAVSILSKLHQIAAPFASVSSTNFVVYTGIGKCVFGSVALLFFNRREGASALRSKSSVVILITSALVSGVSYLLQLNSAKTLPASVLYPIVTGGSIIFSALAGKMFFREKLSSYQRISIALCFMGTILFL